MWQLLGLPSTQEDGEEKSSASGFFGRLSPVFRNLIKRITNTGRYEGEGMASSVWQ